MSIRCAFHDRLGREDGFTLIEVVVALTLIALASTGFAVTANRGLGMVGISQERQAAVQVANEWMEEARVIPISNLALSSGTVFEGAGTPDESVGGAGTTYTFTIDGASVTEALVFADSALDHVAVEEVNSVEFTLYRYVTWVPDGADTEAYKRVTVVVQWDGHGSGDDAITVSQSSIMNGETIAWSATTSTSSTSSTSTSSTSSTTTTSTPAVCDGDTAGPASTLSILAGSGAQSGYTSSSTVTISMTASDACTPISVQYSNDGSGYSENEVFTTSDVWTLEGGEGSRTMYARFSDGAGNQSVRSANVIVDSTAPSTPGTFTATVLNGPKRVELGWTQSSDAQGVIGYRIYRQHGSGSFQNQSTGVNHPCPTSPCTWTDVDVRNNNSYTYYVVAYDAAGNESVPTNQLTRTI